MSICDYCGAIISTDLVFAVHDSFLSTHHLNVSAQFFDIDRTSDPSTDLPHMMPSATHFAEAVSQLGISNSSQVVVYDGAGVFSAARAHFMFRYFGHDNVQVLSGGLPLWIQHGYELEFGEPTKVEKGSFKALGERRELVIAYQELVEKLKQGSLCVMDARSNGRFQGVDPEPRPTLRGGGHMPGAVNVPWSSLQNANGFLPREELRKILAPILKDERPLVTTCGSGLSACVVNLALLELGREDVRLYDGSWSEYGNRPESEVVKSVRQKQQ